MDKQKPFIGSWTQFAFKYGLQAEEYKATYASLFQEYTQHLSPDGLTVIYCMYANDALYLHTYYEHIVHHSVVIIIVESNVTIHLVDDGEKHKKHISFLHVVVKQNGYCVYEQLVSSTKELSWHQQAVITVGTDATCYYYALYSGNSTMHHTIKSDMQHSRASLFFKGFFCATKDQTIAIDSYQNHTVDHAESSFVLKGFAAQKAQVIYKGHIYIDHAAVHSIARQEHKTLLIGNEAKVQSVPVLEVVNNEVQCAHASAIGMLDENALFYLESRGFSFKQACKLLLMSYVVCNDQTLLLIDKKIIYLVNELDFFC